MRKSIVVAFLIVLVVTLIVWGFSYFLQPMLDQEVNFIIFLFFLALVAVVSLLSDISTIVMNISRKDGVQHLDIKLGREQKLRVRRNMLQLVWNNWIEGVLNNSLFNEVFIELKMETRPGAVQHPWDMVLQSGDGEPKPISPHARVIDIYDQASGNLLILGEPGSGKTTMLLELARQAISRAESDYSQPIPVIFNLFTWNPRLSIPEWIIEELRDKYHIPDRVAHFWVSSNELMFLLDGFDEVNNDYREECVYAINRFLKEYGSSVVICSRVAEYEGIAVSLKLQAAIQIKPLTQQQIEEYLKNAGEHIAAAYLLLTSYDDLKTLLQTPLMLNIVILAFENISLEELRLMAINEEGRRYLFDAYIDRMINKKRFDPRYSRTNTVKWLSWLARRMIENSQSIFYVENMQPNWLRFPQRILQYKVAIGLFLWLLFGSIFALTGKLWGGLLMGLIFALIIWTGINDFGYQISILNKYRFAVKTLRGQLIGGLLPGVALGLAYGILYGAISGFIYGILFGLILAFFIGLYQSQDPNTEYQAKPGQGIKLAFGTALLGGCLYASLGILLFGPYRGLIIGVLIGLLFYGGRSLLALVFLRFFLFLSGYLPWNYVHFLNHATDRVFLRRVGGGYIFVHRLLMDHFASIESQV